MNVPIHSQFRVPTAQGKRKIVKSNSRQGKHREFENFGKTQGKHREFENFRMILKSNSQGRDSQVTFDVLAVRGGGGQNTITDCAILFIKSTGKNINFTGKTQGI